MVSRGITIRQNSTTRLTSTIMLNGFFTTFKIRFFSLFFVKGFRGRSFFDTITPLSHYCRELAREFSKISCPHIQSPCRGTHNRALIRGQIVQTFALRYVHYKEFLTSLSIDIFAILQRFFYWISQFLSILHNHLLSLFYMVFPSVFPAEARGEYVFVNALRPRRSARFAV